MRAIKRLSLGLAVLLLLLAAAFYSGAQLGLIPPINDLSKDDRQALQGQWLSDGYGWLLSVDGHWASLYDHTATQCTESDELAGPLAFFPIEIISNDGHTVEIEMFGSPYSYYFNKLESLPDRCQQAPDSSPTAVVTSLLDFFDQHYVFFEARAVDWRIVKNQALASVTDDASNEALFSILSAVIAKIPDGHVNLAAEIGGEQKKFDTGLSHEELNVKRDAASKNLDYYDHQRTWMQVHREQVRDIILNGEGSTGIDQESLWLQYGALADNIGYIMIGIESYPWSDDPQSVFTRFLNEALSSLAASDAIILDLAMNFGGEDEISRLIAGHFAHARTHAYSKFAGDAENAAADTATKMFIEPSDGEVFTKPVYLLTANTTISAGEILTLSMRSLGQVSHWGMPTRGALSDVLPKTLPNGWTVTLSNEVYLDPEGNAWEGRGIPVEQEIPMFDPNDAFAGHPEAVEQVRLKVLEALAQP